MLYEVYVVHSTIIFPGSRVSDFARNLRAQKLNKAHRQSERTYGSTVFYRALVLLTCTSAGVVSTSSFGLSSLRFISSQFAPTSLFAAVDPDPAPDTLPLSADL